MEELIKVENISKSFYSAQGLFSKKSETKALKNVNLTINKGETFGLIGESGSGKTTLGRIILGLEEESDGDITFAGLKRNAKNKSQIQKKMQVIFQDPFSSLNPYLSALESVMEPLLLHTNKAEAQEKALEILELVGINKENAQKRPKAFSGGQRQRISIARAVVANPEFILCDEPTSALDVSIQGQIINLLKDIQKKLNLTYLFISHDLSVVRFISDRVAIMYKGQIVEIGPTTDIFANPQHSYTKHLLNSALQADPVKARAQMLEIEENYTPQVLQTDGEWKEVAEKHFVLK